MKVSYNWINEYLNGKMPTPEKVGELLTMHSMEIESMEKVGDDTVMDAKTTPNLNHSCLCHRGIAREIGVILGVKTNQYSREFKDFKVAETEKKLEIKISDEKRCRRYIGRIIENIKAGESPKWLKEKLEVIGQRSINNIVDATNFVMNEIGQPMHAFDADKLSGKDGQILIEVKNCKSNDHITTLDKKEVDLDESVLAITSDGIPLAIAGIKGGTCAELEESTKNIVLESASFDPVLIRKTAQKLKIQTDASKRYENDYSPEMASEAMDVLTKLIVEIAGTKDTKVGETVDVYPNPEKKYILAISVKEASEIIGIQFTEKIIDDIFSRFGFEYKKETLDKKTNDIKYLVTIPDERLDLRIKEDLAEEIGRIYGYEKIGEVSTKFDGKPEVNKGFYYKDKIRRILNMQGFSEVINYTFRDVGEVEIENSISPEKRFLRTNLADGIKDSLEFNARYSELVEMPQIRIFEFGHIFTNKGEFERFIIGVKNPVGLKKPKEQDILNDAVVLIEKELGIKLNKINSEDNIAEFDFDKIIGELSEPEKCVFSEPTGETKYFKKISQYPFMIRDVAVFTPEGTKAEEVFEIIKKEAGDLAVKNRLFDVFTKKFEDGSSKTSYAYRLVFQSYEKTLTDSEVNSIMDNITQKLNAQKGWQVR